MSLTETVAFWETVGLIDKNDPNQPTPTHEDALRQFTFSAISDFIEEHADELATWLMYSTDPEVPELSAWVDEYAARAPQEPGGYARSQP